MRSRFVVAITVVPLFAACVARGQAAAGQAPAHSLAFEVATIKPAAPLDMSKMAAEIQAGRMPKVGPRVTAAQAEYDYMSLKDLLAQAYKLKPYQITGPNWLATQRFDILARMPDGASVDDAPAMLRSLLADRFKLTAHDDTQEHPVLALVVGKGGPKLKEAPAPAALPDDSVPLKSGEMKIDTPQGPARVTRNPDGSSTVNMGAKGLFTQKMDMQARTLRIEASSSTMEGFADMLTNVMQMGGQTGGNSGRQVVDMTGLKGNYQVAVDISLADLMANMKAQGIDMPAGRPGGGGGTDSASTDAADPSGGTSVYASVQALGLKLEPRKAPTEQLVVDHIEKTATEN